MGGGTGCAAMRGAFALSAADLKERVVLDCRFVGVEPAAGRIFFVTSRHLHQRIGPLVLSDNRQMTHLRYRYCVGQAGDKTQVE